MEDGVPNIEGAKGAATEVEERVERQEVLEENNTLDLPTKRPVDEVIPSRDVTQPKPTEKLMEEAKQGLKRNVSDKQRAALARAREIKAEKRRRLEAEGRNAAQGTPVPDVLTHVSSVLEKQFANVFARVDDLEKRLAHEAPLQENGIVSTPSKEVPTVAIPADIKPIAPKEEIISPPISHVEPMDETSQKIMEQQRMKAESEQARRDRRLRRALHHVQFLDEHTEERARQDYDANGATPFQKMSKGHVLF